jgi:hypothetical protein
MGLAVCNEYSYYNSRILFQLHERSQCFLLSVSSIQFAVLIQSLLMLLMRYNDAVFA